MVLVIIDFQEEFLDTIDNNIKRNIISNTCEIIKHFKRKEKPIIIAEFENCGPTDSKITQLVKNYAYFTKPRSYQNKAPSIRPVLRKLKIKPEEKIFISGMYVEQCVISTIKGLKGLDSRTIYKYNNIVPIADCCISHFSHNFYNERVRCSTTLQNIQTSKCYFQNSTKLKYDPICAKHILSGKPRYKVKNSYDMVT